MLGGRASELESRLAVQGKMLAERGFENHQLRQQMEALQAGDQPSRAVETLRAEKATLEQQLTSARDERAKMQRETAGDPAAGRSVVGQRAHGERGAARAHQRHRG